MNDVLFTPIRLYDLEVLIKNSVETAILNSLSNLDSRFENQNEHLTIKEATKILNLAIPTIYSKCSKGELPYFKKGKKLYFSKDELTKYLNSGKQLTNEEISENVESYLTKKGLNNE